jgi:hypothetical protein
MRPFLASGSSLGKPLFEPGAFVLRAIVLTVAADSHIGAAGLEPVMPGCRSCLSCLPQLLLARFLNPDHLRHAIGPGNTPWLSLMKKGGHSGPPLGFS